MDEFNYLSVLVSIILGLGITQLLTGVGRMLQNRARVRLYWLTIGWVLILLLVHVQLWWSMFELRGQREWTFLGFFSVLILPIVLYLMSALALPDFGDTVADDLRDHYYANCRWSYALAFILVVLTYGREAVLAGAIDRDLDSAAKLLFAALFIAGAITRRPRVHEVLVPANLALLLIYIGTLFRDLPGR
ncbi:MAG TPA: hypothetical protein VK698_13680 [Kofleriaceae bacterium]|nr:hypothetical protein [Kofleriaceae bacterium]